MKKGVIAAMLLLFVVGCSVQEPQEDPVEEPVLEEQTLIGVVESVETSSLMVRFMSSNDFDVARVSYEMVDDAIQADDLVELSYNGNVEESDPVQIQATSLSVLLDFSQAPAYRMISYEHTVAVLELYDVVLLDVRPTSSYEAGHLDGAINIPMAELTARIGSEVMDLNKGIIVYCQTPSASKEASILLVELGYRNVFDFGSIDNWKGN